MAAEAASRHSKVGCTMVRYGPPGNLIHIALYWQSDTGCCSWWMAAEAASRRSKVGCTMVRYGPPGNLIHIAFNFINILTAQEDLFISISAAFVR